MGLENSSTSWAESNNGGAGTRGFTSPHRSPAPSRPSTGDLDIATGAPATEEEVSIGRPRGPHPRDLSVRVRTGAPRRAQRCRTGCAGAVGAGPGRFARGLLGCVAGDRARSAALHPPPQANERRASGDDSDRCRVPAERVDRSRRQHPCSLAQRPRRPATDRRLQHARADGIRTGAAPDRITRRSGSCRSRPVEFVKGGQCQRSSGVRHRRDRRGLRRRPSAGSRGLRARRGMDGRRLRRRPGAMCGAARRATVTP